MPNFSKPFKIAVVTYTNLQLQFITHRQNFKSYHSRSLVLQPRALQNSLQGTLIHINFCPVWTDKLETHCVPCPALTGSLCELGLPLTPAQCSQTPALLSITCVTKLKGAAMLRGLLVQSQSFCTPSHQSQNTQAVTAATLTGEIRCYQYEA